MSGGRHGGGDGVESGANANVALIPENKTFGIVGLLFIAFMSLTLLTAAHDAGKAGF